MRNTINRIFTFFWSTVIVNNYWSRLRKMPWFVSGDLRLRQIIDLRDNDKSRYSAIIKTKFYQAICHFSRKSDRKKKRVVVFTHEQNIICSQTQVDDIVHEQTIMCRQLFAGHVVGFRPIKRNNKLHRMINTVLSDNGLIVQLVALREMIMFGNFSATFEVLGKF